MVRNRRVLLVTFLVVGFITSAYAQDFDFVVGGGGPSSGIFMPDIEAISGFVVTQDSQR